MTDGCSRNYRSKSPLLPDRIGKISMQWLFDAWPALCTLVGLALLLLLIIRWQWSAFVGLIVVSVGIGLAAGMAPVTVVETVSTGIASILKEVTVILALGAMLGRIL